MANDILGSELNVQIPDNLFKNIKELDDHLNKLSATADNTGATISKMFRTISVQGADKVIQDLYDQRLQWNLFPRLIHETIDF